MVFLRALLRFACGGTKLPFPMFRFPFKSLNPVKLNFSATESEDHARTKRPEEL